VNKKQKIRYNTLKGKINFNKQLRRYKRRHLLIVNHLKNQVKFKQHCLKMGLRYEYVSYERNLVRSKLKPKPELSDNLKYLLTKNDLFSTINIKRSHDGKLIVPEIFSLIENPNESFKFLKKLFYTLYYQSSEVVVIDYIYCKHIDVDASACMDILLADFVNHYRESSRRGHVIRLKTIKPINFHISDNVKRTLYSIGVFRNLKGIRIKYPGVIEFPLRIGDNRDPNKTKLKEIHETQIVDYILSCLEKTNRTLSITAQTQLSRVIGEVIANAEEHSDTRYRYAIGYFLQNDESTEQIGDFNLCIFNFGRTIYESFKFNCKNGDVLDKMKSLSDEFTKRKLFKPAKYEEETLWTLYALQDGVTRFDNWNRGHGSIKFIESFFNLRGEQNQDNPSKLVIISGNTRIVFDGSYGITEKVNSRGNKFQVMTFNNSGDITEPPDEKFVTFADNFFPGTIISAKIYINKESIRERNNENNAKH